MCNQELQISSPCCQPVLHSEKVIFFRSDSGPVLRKCQKCYFFIFQKGEVFGLDPVYNGSEELRRHLTRCADPSPLSIQK
jgi:hypothetical protein